MPFLKHWASHGPSVEAKNMEPSERETQACELLDAFVPDLITDKKFEGFLGNLFGCERGVWLSVRMLCEGLVETAAVFETLTRLTDSELAVVWLDHPQCGGYAYVHFYLDAFFWTNSAICRLGPGDPITGYKGTTRHEG